MHFGSGCPRAMISLARILAIGGLKCWFYGLAWHLWSGCVFADSTLPTYKHKGHGHLGSLSPCLLYTSVSSGAGLSGSLDAAVAGAAVAKTLSCTCAWVAAASKVVGGGAGTEVSTATAPGWGAAATGGPKPVSGNVPSGARLIFMSLCYARDSRLSQSKSACSGPTRSAA